MKSKKAPKVSKYNLDDNYMKEYSFNDRRSKKKEKNPQWPMSKKRLSK